VVRSSYPLGGAPGDLQVLHGRGDGRLTMPTSTRSVGGPGVAVGDLNGDGKPDLVSSVRGTPGVNVGINNSP
jgi:hypothetical protein